jgi:peptidoglycan/LPS O-acetylase OafA/YrhL
LTRDAATLNNLATQVEPHPEPVTAPPPTADVEARRAPAPVAADRADPRARRAISWLWPESGALSPIPALDGMRALAVLLVMLFHAWYNQPGMLAPGQAVDASPIWYARTGLVTFFVLSGFLLFLPYAQWSFGAAPMPSARKFYKRRILRVGPAYWVCLSLLVLTAPLTAASLLDGLVHIPFIFNAVPASIFSINGVFWTMAVEVQFYAVLPLIGWALYRLAQKIGTLSAAAAVFAAMLCISFASGLANRLGGVEQIPVVSAIAGQRSMSFYLAIFGCGIMVSVAYTYLTRVAPPDAAGLLRLKRIAVACMVLAVFVGVGFAFKPSILRIEAGRNIFYGAVFGLLLFGILFAPARWRWIFATPAVRFVGLVSYSLYLWHTIVLNFIVGWIPQSLSQTDRVLLGFALELVIAVPVAYVSYLLVERPFMMARKRAH